MTIKKKGTILVTLKKREKDYSTFPLPYELEALLPKEEVQFWTSLMDPWPEEAEENKMVMELRKKCIDDDEYSELMVIVSKWEAICELLRGEEVSDFMLSFPEVRQVSDMVGYGGIR